MSLLATRVIEAFLLPPLSLILLGVLGLVLLRRRPRLGGVLVFIALGLFYVASLPPVARVLTASLETVPAITDIAQAEKADAIVVLGGRVYPDAPEYGDDVISGAGLERLRYGAHLYRATGLPILVTGGAPEGTQRTEGGLMKQILEREFAVPVHWAEERSVNTFENAMFSREILEAEGIDKIYLVTHAYHMPRAVLAFEKAGFEVVPAPTRFHPDEPLTWLDILPSAYAIANTRATLHEWLGRLWYSVRGDPEESAGESAEESAAENGPKP